MWTKFKQTIARPVTHYGNRSKTKGYGWLRSLRPLEGAHTSDLMNCRCQQPVVIQYLQQIAINQPLFMVFVDMIAKEYKNIDCLNKYSFRVHISGVSKYVSKFFTLS